MEDFKGVEYHEFFEGRRIYIQGDIPIGKDWASRIDLLTQISQEPISISINSDGGDLLAGIEVMRSLELAASKGVETIGVVRGWACSSALNILQSCSVRMMHKGDILMAHGIRDDAGGSAVNIKAETGALKIWVDFLAGFYARRSLEKSYWQGVFSCDEKYYWGASSAKRIGLVDKIIGG